MKIVTLNAHSWIEEQPYEKLDSLVESIVQADYDLIALQEINQSADAEEATEDTFISPKENQFAVPLKSDNFACVLVRKLKQKGLPYFWSWTANHTAFDKYDEGVAILSKTSFEAEGHLVSESTDYASYFTRKILKAQIERDGTKWTVLSVHYSWWNNAEGTSLFRYEWERTLDMLQSDEKDTLIILGDFNNDAKMNREGYDLVRETAPFLKDTFEEADVITGESTIRKAIDGWEGHTDDKRIDYIFVGDPIQVVQHKVVFDGDNSPVISDHFGIEALIEKKLT